MPEKSMQKCVIHLRILSYLEEILYEPMNYGRPQAETGHVASPPEKVRLPLPAPKPPKKLPPTKPTVTSSSSNSEPLPKKIISPSKHNYAESSIIR